jgi:hypothetical protein
MQLKLFGVAVISLGLLAGACANASTDAGTGDGGTGSGGQGGDGGGISYPTAADQVVLRIEQGGGFVAPQYTLTSIPLFSLFGDGLVVTPGAQIEIFPSPALPALTQQRLSADAIQELLQAAIDAGLNTDHSYTNLGSVGIADAATTTFTLTVDGQTHTIKVYALSELGSKPDRMSQDEYQARQDLFAFETKATDLSWLPQDAISDRGLYQPSGLRLFVSRYQPDPNLTEPSVEWPLSPGLASFGDPFQDGLDGTRCGTVVADAAATLLPVVEQVNQLTPWTSEGTRYGILFRPLLPDESGC